MKYANEIYFMHVNFKMGVPVKGSAIWWPKVLNYVFFFFFLSFFSHALGDVKAQKPPADLAVLWRIGSLITFCDPKHENGDVRLKTLRTGDADLRFLHYNCARRMTQICVFNTRLFSLHNTLNYAIHRACLRMVLLTEVYRNLTSLWINL